MALIGWNELVRTLLLATLSVGLLVVLDRGLIPFLRFRAPRDPGEPPLWGWAEIVLILGVWHLTQILTTVALGQILGVDDTHAMDARAFALAQVFTAFVTMLLGVRLLRDRLGQPLSALGLRNTSPWNLLPTVVLWSACIVPMGCILIGWNLALQELFGHEFVVQSTLTLSERYVESGDWLSLGCLVFSAVVVAPVIEECIFRGGIFGPLRVRWGGAAAALISSAIFGAVHYSLSVFLPLAFLGCVLCYLYRRTGSLWPCMVLHALFNAATFAKLLFL